MNLASINDDLISDNTTYSSDKINTLMSTINENTLSAVTENGEKYNIDSFNLKKGRFEWSKVGTIPFDLSYGLRETIYYNGEIHIFGSYSDYKKHYKFNPLTETWINCSTFPNENGFQSRSVVVYNDKLHVLGGFMQDEDDMFSEFGLDCIYTFDETTNTWVEDELILPYGFNCGISVVYNNELYIIGGFEDGSSYESLNYFYKLDENLEWIELESLPIEVNSNGYAIVCNNEIHVLFNNEHYKFNGESWSYVGELYFQTSADSVYTSSVIVWNDEIHILGGRRDKKK